jgi:hypothetical protein
LFSWFESDRSRDISFNCDGLNRERPLHRVGDVGCTSREQTLRMVQELAGHAICQYQMLLALRLPDSQIGLASEHHRLLAVHFRDEI